MKVFNVRAKMFVENFDYQKEIKINIEAANALDAANKTERLLRGKGYRLPIVNLPHLRRQEKI